MTVVCEVTYQMLLRRGNRWRVTSGLINPRPGADNTEPVFCYRWVSQALKEGAVSKKDSKRVTDSLTNKPNKKISPLTIPQKRESAGEDNRKGGTKVGEVRDEATEEVVETGLAFYNVGAPM